MTRIAITGIRGFIGANLAAGAVDRSWQVVGVDLPESEERNSLEALGVHLLRGRGDVYYNRDVREHLGIVFDKPRPDIVVHLAAEPIVEKAEEYARRAFDVNVMGTVNVLESCRDHDVPCIVASSDKAYGDALPAATMRMSDEGVRPTASVFTEADALRPKYPYDVSKACQDLIAQSYRATYGLPVIVTRSVNVFGPGDLNWSRLVPHTCRAAMYRKPPHTHRPMWTTRREWVYVDDEVSAYLFLAHRLMEEPEVFSRSYPVVNIGSGAVATPSEVVPKILRLAGSWVTPVLEDTPFHELADEAVDRSLLRHAGWQPRWTLDHGLQKTVAWYQKYLEREA